MNKFMEMRAWGNGLSHPIYVPSDFDDIKLMLSRGMISAACDALWRRAALGSDSAAALLGYIDLRHGLADGIDRSEVATRCVYAANRNDGFAQYVLAWKAYELGDFSVFGKWLDRSARQGFVPAIVDTARIKVQTGQATKVSRRNSKTNFWVAFKRGHVVCASVFFLCCAKGNFGNLFRLAGYIGLPLSLIFVWLTCVFSPFSIRVFLYPVGTKKDLFSSR